MSSNEVSQNGTSTTSGVQNGSVLPEHLLQRVIAYCEPLYNKAGDALSKKLTINGMVQTVRTQTKTFTPELLEAVFGLLLSGELAFCAPQDALHRVEAALATHTGVSKTVPDLLAEVLRLFIACVHLHANNAAPAPAPAPAPAGPTAAELQKTFDAQILSMQKEHEDEVKGLRDEYATALANLRAANQRYEECQQLQNMPPQQQPAAEEEGKKKRKSPEGENALADAQRELAQVRKSASALQMQLREARSTIEGLKNFRASANPPRKLFESDTVPSPDMIFTAMFEFMKHTPRKEWTTATHAAIMLIREMFMPCPTILREHPPWSTQLKTLVASTGAPVGEKTTVSSVVVTREQKAAARWVELNENASERLGNLRMSGLMLSACMRAGKPDLSVETLASISKFNANVFRAFAPRRMLSPHCGELLLSFIPVFFATDLLTAMDSVTSTTLDKVFVAGKRAHTILSAVCKMVGVKEVSHAALRTWLRDTNAVVKFFDNFCFVDLPEKASNDQVIVLSDDENKNREDEEEDEEEEEDEDEEEDKDKDEDEDKGKGKGKGKRRRLDRDDSSSSDASSSDA